MSVIQVCKYAIPVSTTHLSLKYLRGKIKEIKYDYTVISSTCVLDFLGEEALKGRRVSSHDLFNHPNNSLQSAQLITGANEKEGCYWGGEDRLNGTDITSSVVFHLSQEVRSLLDLLGSTVIPSGFLLHVPRDNSCWKLKSLHRYHRLSGAPPVKFRVPDVRYRSFNYCLHQSENYISINRWMMVCWDAQVKKWSRSIITIILSNQSPQLRDKNRSPGSPLVCSLVAPQLTARYTDIKMCIICLGSMGIRHLVARWLSCAFSRYATGSRTLDWK